MNASITCKRCGAKCPICGHIAADLSGLAEMREKLAAAEIARDRAREALRSILQDTNDERVLAIARAALSTPTPE